MTFAQILQDTYARCNYASSPASAVVTRIKQNVNETHEGLLSEPALQSLLYGTMTLTDPVTISENSTFTIKPTFALTASNAFNMRGLLMTIDQLRRTRDETLDLQATTMNPPATHFVHLCTQCSRTSRLVSSSVTAISNFAGPPSSVR